MTLLLVNIFPARRHARHSERDRRLGGGRDRRPLPARCGRSDLARPEGFRSLVDFITILRGPTSPLLPSEWMQHAVMSWLNGRPQLLPYYLLWSTAAAAIVFGAVIHRWLYAWGSARPRRAAQRFRQRGGDGARSATHFVAAQRGAARARAQGNPRLLPRQHAVVAADSAGCAGRGVRVQHPLPSAARRRRDVLSW